MNAQFLFLTFLVALGGGFGAILRHFTVSFVSFPLGTLVVNVLGCFVIGLTYILTREVWGGALQGFVMTGVFGGFTTFSAFSLDTLRLVEQGALGGAMIYVFGSVGLSLAAVFLGAMIARGML